MPDNIVEHPPIIDGPSGQKLLFAQYFTPHVSGGPPRGIPECRMESVSYQSIRY